ncbi:MFS transporter [Streptomyces sp. J2-1]|uniref:MFS transporter n=1 Tax=Streptomyces corallincola TaxID=2851888 RepID=UPI001C3878BD|nr:MFS transporter [Streptomyces corallincola]MBV2358084.1 MFS transporter [Streptomyces corallincola]
MRASRSSGTSTAGRTVSPVLAILICTVVTVMEGYSLIVYGSVIPLLLSDKSLALTPSAAGLVGSVIYAGMLIGALVSGVIGDRIGRQPVLLVGMGLFILGFVATGFAGSVATLGLARLLSGLGVGGAISTALALARNHAPRGRAGLVINITMAGIPLGGALTAAISLYVLPHWGWRPMFFIGAALTLVIFAVVLLVRLEDRSAFASSAAHARTDRRTADRTGQRTDAPADKASQPQSGPQPHPHPRPLSELFHGRGRLLALLIAAVAIPNMFTWFGLNVWLTAAMTSLHYPLTSALLFSLVLTAGAVVGSMIAAPLADRFGLNRVTLITSVLTLAGLIGIVAGAHYLPLLLVFVALMGAGGHTTENLLNASASDLFPASIRGTVLGWTNGMSYVGAIGPIAGGLVIGSHFGAYGVFVLFGVSACVVVVAVAAFTAVVRRRPTPAAVAQAGPGTHTGPGTPSPTPAH